MDNFTATVLPVPVVYATAISIIVIAFAILLWLVLTTLFLTLLFKKLNDLTKNISKLTETWNEKSKQIADQTTATIQSFQIKPKMEDGKEKKNNLTSVLGGIIGIGSLFFEVFKMFNNNKNRREK